MAPSKHVCVEGSRFLGVLKKSVYNLKSVLCRDSVRVYLTIDILSLFSITEPTMPPSRNGSSRFRCFLLLVQGVLGDMNSWSSTILNLIFVDEYSARNTIDTVAFFYGNRVPVKDAWCFHTLCNEHNPLLSTFHFTVFYKLWETMPVVCPYYDVRLKKMLYIHSHLQPDSPADGITLGIDETGNGQLIRDRIAQVFGVHGVS